jgi:hypothetical protein
MVLNRTNENAWEQHYMSNANGEYEEGQSFHLLSIAEQRIVKNQMHYASRNWAYFYVYSAITKEFVHTGAERRTGLPDEALMNLLVIALHALKVKERAQNEDGSEIHSNPMTAPAQLAHSSEALQKRLEEEYEIKKKLNMRNSAKPLIGTRYPSLIGRANPQSWLTSSLNLLWLSVDGIALDLKRIK